MPLQRQRWSIILCKRLSQTLIPAAEIIPLPNAQGLSGTAQPFQHTDFFAQQFHLSHRTFPGLFRPTSLTLSPFTTSSNNGGFGPRVCSQRCLSTRPFSTSAEETAPGGAASKAYIADGPTIAKLEDDLAASEAAAGATSYAAADACLGLAIWHFRQGRLAEVETFARRILATLAALGSRSDGGGEEWSNRVVVCECFLNLAIAHVQGERSEQGLEWSRHARDVISQGGGSAKDGHGYLLAMSETVAGMALTGQGKFPEAADAADRALSIFEGSLPPGHQYVHQAKVNAASAYVKLGRIGAAMKHLDDVAAAGSSPLRVAALKKLMPLAMEAGDEEKAKMCFRELRREGYFEKPKPVDSEEEE